jgi:hypothetical protein
MQTKPPTTVAEWREQIEAGKKIALRRLENHAADETQSEISRDVCGMLAKRMRDSGVAS